MPISSQLEERIAMGTKFVYGVKAALKEEDPRRSGVIKEDGRPPRFVWVSTFVRTVS